MSRPGSSRPDGRGQPVPAWALLSSLLAPIALIGGWTIAASRQPRFDSVHATISALAAHGAHQRWIMTAGLAALGCCHLVTAAGLRPARRPGRVLLGAGGLATILVAVFAQPVHGDSAPHLVFAALGFGCLAGWPLLAARAGAGGLLEPGAARLGGALLIALLVMFALTLSSPVAGLTERLLAGAQACWPLATVLAARRIGR